MIGIYAIFRKSDDKCMYVGQSKDVERRKREHFGKNSKFNVTDHYFKVLESFESIDNETKLNREAYWINELNPELNICRNRHFNLTPEQIKKFSTSHIGSKRTPEQCENIRKSHIGQKAWNKGLTKETDERVAKYSQKLRKSNKHKSNE